ncbi:ABC transporter permease [Paenibacillus beijingensis]|uniref:ABC transporter permease n=2 Tax=Paenibacillus beijingensis TaxID=1126833 RepID=A0A0D5NRA5_9BACL|nr:ABC transporter permease [Paenibacillus beijingensis]
MLPSTRYSLRRQTALKLGKYTAVGKISLRQQFAYVTDFLLRSLFLLLILFVFMQLWRAAYAGVGAGHGTMAGFSLKQIIWYLVFTEAVTMACPHLCQKIEDEVKNGDIAVRLLTPLSYIGYHYFSYMAEAALRFIVNLAIGSAIGWLLVGAPQLGAGWAGMAALVLGALSLAFILNMTIALCAFWVEETRGLEFVLQKLQFTVGGMLIPLDLMPYWLQRVCAWLPFRAVLYFPARIGVAFDARLLAEFAAIQAAWIGALAAFVVWLYRKGVRKLNVNGG